MTKEEYRLAVYEGLKSKSTMSKDACWDHSASFVEGDECYMLDGWDPEGAVGEDAQYWED